MREVTLTCITPEIVTANETDKQIDKWEERFKLNGCFKDLSHMADKDLCDRIFDYLLRYNGPMLGSESFWGLVMELIKRRKNK